MPKKVEQVTRTGKVVLDYDTYYKGDAIFSKLINILGPGRAAVVKDGALKILTYKRNDGKIIGLLTKYVTYLGHPHDLHKKRIQLPYKYQLLVNYMPDFLDDIKFIGMYEYDGRSIIIDFLKDSYMRRNLNNSSAHVHTIDLIKATLHGEFSKIDRNGNQIVLLDENHIIDYLETDEIKNPDIIETLSDFTNYIPKEPVYLIDAMKQMYDDGNSNWQQTRWSGWYLEYLFQKYLKENHLENKIEFGFQTGPLGLKLDLWFIEEEHYGDLKAHGDSSGFVMGNDIEVVALAIKHFGKLWYLIAENKAFNDDRNKTANKQRIDYIYNKTEELKTIPRAKVKAYYKYHSLVLIEINESNMQYLDEFQQGWVNSDGNYRNGKISIKSKYLKDDNMVIFRKKI